MADPYHDLAADYDLIFEDQAVAGGGAINAPAPARLFSRIDPASTILDAACGTGIDAAALARRGFTVHAADASRAMTGAAAARFTRDGLAIPVRCCQWTGLPAAISERFDVVLCTGNALVHAAGHEAMSAALTALRQMTRPGGHVVIDSRNWEKLHADRQVIQVKEHVRTRAGRRYITLYVWEIPPRLDQEHTAHITFLYEDGDRIEPHEHQISFRPFTIGELRERLQAAGLREIDTDYDPATDRYDIIAVAT